MARFMHSLNIKTRAIAPEYVAQWFDRIFTYDSVPDGVDFMEAGYPYSAGNQQVVSSPYTLPVGGAGGTISDGVITTIISGNAIQTISGVTMTRISA